MQAIVRPIELKLQHQVFFTEEVFAPGNPLLAELLVASRNVERPKVLVVLDEGLHRARPALAQSVVTYFHRHRAGLNLVSPPVTVEGGERVKNAYFHVSDIQSEIDRYNIDRHSFLVAAGGGAFLDVAGLAAATAHRGINHVRLPSTTLGQADSGVGIKNGINAFGKKNFIGTFAIPYAVINDYAFLTSLPDRDKRSGFSEAVKVACIKDREFFTWLERSTQSLAVFDPEAVRKAIYRSAELHVNHIATAGDPFETGSARPLDFGHWAAHKLEQLSEYRIRHGEAVAVGIAIDTIYSRLAGYLAEAEAERILTLLERLGFDLFANELCHLDSEGEFIVLRGLEEFRVHLGGQLTVTLLKDIGKGFEVHDMDPKLVARAIKELECRKCQQTLRVAAAQ